MQKEAAGIEKWSHLENGKWVVNYTHKGRGGGEEEIMCEKVKQIQEKMVTNPE